VEGKIHFLNIRTLSSALGRWKSSNSSTRGKQRKEVRIRERGGERRPTFSDSKKVFLSARIREK